MEVELIKPYGFCSGVEFAFSSIRKIRKDNPNKTIVVLGMLVHNDDALKELNDLNIKTTDLTKHSIDNYLKKVDINDIIFVFTAHGHDRSFEKYLVQKKANFIDLTCPYVKTILKNIETKINEHKKIIYVGKSGHPEAEAALSLDKNIYLLEENKKLPKFDLNANIFVTNQTTLSHDYVDNVSICLTKHFNNLEFEKSICNASYTRQNIISKMILNSDECLIILGGKKSNNTLSLYQAALINNKPDNVFYPESYDLIADFIKNHNFKKYYISSGTSTPNKLVEEVYNSILTIK